MGRRPAGEPPLTIGIIEELKNKGYSQNEIAEMFGVSRQAVSWHKQNYNGSRTPREEVNAHFPWKVPHEMNQSTQYRRLRDHGEFIATGGKGMNENKLKRLRSWYRKLLKENVVVEFDPSIPPEPGVSSVGGFTYRPRRKSDDDLLIRVNKHTNLTDEGRMIWRFPPEMP